MKKIIKLFTLLLLGSSLFISACNTDEKLSNQKNDLITYVDEEIDTLESSLITKIDETIAKINALEEKHDAKVLELEGIDKSIKEVQDAHTNEINSLNDELDSLVAQYENKISELESKDKELKDSLSALELEIANQNELNEAKHNSLTSEIEKIKGDLAKLEEEHGNDVTLLNEKLDSLQNELNELETLMSEQDKLMKEEYTSLVNQLEEVDKEIKEVNENQNKNIKEIEDNIALVNETHERDIETLTNQKNEIIEEINTIKTDIESLNSNLSKEISDVKTSLNGLETMLNNEDTRLQGEITKLNNLVDTLSTLIESNNGKINELQQELEDLRNELEEKVCDEHNVLDWELVEVLEDGTKIYVQKCDKCDTIIDMNIEKYEGDYVYDHNVHYIINEDGTYSNANNHIFIDEYCIECGVHESIISLDFTLLENGLEYAIVRQNIAWYGDLLIPREYKGLPVTTILDNNVLMSGYDKSIIIPDSMVNINLNNVGFPTGSVVYFEAKELPEINEEFWLYYSIYLGYGKGDYLVELQIDGNYRYGAYVNTGDMLPNFNVPTRKGYIFTGFYNQTGTKYYDENMNCVKAWDKEENGTLYAQWESETYKIIFDANGGEGEMSSMEVTYEDAYLNESLLLKNTFNYEDMKFIGWSLYKDNEVIYIDESSVYEIIYDVNPQNNEEIRLYAVWEKSFVLPDAWKEGSTYQAVDCSISLVPGSINNPDAKPVKNYLNSGKIRFIDLRDVSEGYGIGHIQGFESISYFKVIVGEGRLFTRNADGIFIPNYEESELILNNMFPKDMTYFVMCQTGGRVSMFLSLLDQYGYVMNKCYNIGGWVNVAKAENYAGYQVSLGIGASSITYDFSMLTPVGSVASLRTLKRAAELPIAWEEGEDYNAANCSVSLVPGSLIGNENSIPVKDLFNLENARFFDLRDVKEGYGLGHIQKFETVSYFNMIVGQNGQLFTRNSEGLFIPNYEESKAIINDIFPKNIPLFIMCQVGGRVPQLLQLLDQLGYDMSNIYNVGGWNHVNNLNDFGGYNVSLGIGASTIEYNYSSLTPININQY